MTTATSLECQTLSLKGPLLITPPCFQDERGFFLESYREQDYLKLGLPPFVQDNHSFSQKNTLRGLHLQSQPGQAKLVRVGSGSILDVIVDMRPNSPTFGNYELISLDDQKHQQLYVPIGFAHGFLVTSETAHVLYKVSSPYCAQTETGFHWQDPDVNIPWPVDPKAAIISKRDQEAPSFQTLIKTLHEAL